MPEAHRVFAVAPAEIDGLSPRRLRDQAGEIHQARLEVLGDAAQLQDLLQHLLDLYRVTVEPLDPALPVVLVHHGAARGPDPVPLLAERLLERARAAVELHRLAHELAELRDQRVDLRHREEARVHCSSTKMAWTSFGPCTPRVRVSSMSAVRDGPVMKLITAPDMLRAGSAWSASSMVPTCSSDSRRQARSKTATWVAGKREVERGRPRPETRTSVPVSARAQSTPVTPISARPAASRWSCRAGTSGSPSGARVTEYPSGPRLFRRSSPSAPGSHDSTRFACRASAICLITPGTSSNRATRWKTPAMRSN